MLNKIREVLCDLADNLQPLPIPLSIIQLFELHPVPSTSQFPLPDLPQPHLCLMMSSLNLPVTLPRSADVIINVTERNVGPNIRDNCSSNNYFLGEKILDVFYFFYVLICFLLLLYNNITLVIRKLTWTFSWPVRCCASSSRSSVVLLPDVFSFAFVPPPQTPASSPSLNAQ